MADRPGYTKDANQTVADIKRCLERDLKGIAERLAAHEKAEKVLVSHVSGAFAALANVGLAKKKFYRRVEFEVGAGTSLFAVASAAPGFVPWIVESENITAIAVPAIIILFVVAGSVLAIHGWIRGST